jgi:outer membrane biogenesis lipoprotein LolB
MNRALFSLALAFLLAACGPPRQFVKPGSSEHQAAKDQQEWRLRGRQGYGQHAYRLRSRMAQRRD